MIMFDPSKPAKPFLGGMSRAATSSFDVRAASLVTVSVTMVLLPGLKWHHVFPIRQTTLCVGRISVPLKFFGLWNTLIMGEASAARKTVSISSVTVENFEASLSMAPRVALNAAIFMFPRSFPGRF